jgi:hypothetical protein
MSRIRLLFVIDVSDPQHSFEHGQLRDHLCKDLVSVKLVKIVERERQEFLPDGTLVNDVLNFIKEFELIPFEGRGCEPLDPDVLFNSLADSIVHHFVEGDVVSNLQLAALLHVK